MVRGAGDALLLPRWITSEVGALVGFPELVAHLVGVLRHLPGGVNDHRPVIDGVVGSANTACIAKPFPDSGALLSELPFSAGTAAAGPSTQIVRLCQWLPCAKA